MYKYFSNMAASVVCEKNCYAFLVRFLSTGGVLN